MTTKDYPDGGNVGTIIHGLKNVADLEHVSVYHGGTKKEANGDIVTNGGRILYIAGRGETVDQAADRAYSVIGPDRKNGIYFADMHYRKDIGYQVRAA
jgi:phosphoribosylamine--glycine ligase